LYKLYNYFFSESFEEKRWTWWPTYEKQVSTYIIEGREGGPKVGQGWAFWPKVQKNTKRSVFFVATLKTNVLICLHHDNTGDIMTQQNNKEESMTMGDVLNIGSEYYEVFGDFFQKKLVKVTDSRYIIITIDGVTLRSIEDWNEYKKDIPEFFTIESLAQLHK